MHSAVVSALAVSALLLACGDRATTPSSGSASPATAVTPPPAASAPAATPPPAASAPAASAPPPAVEPGPAVPPLRTLVAAASHCLTGDASRRGRVIADQPALEDWLARVACRGGDALPPVDFAREVVLAVDGPDGTNACHAVRITDVTAGPNGLVAAVTRFTPPPAKVCAQVMVRPVHAVVVARPAEGVAVTFEWRDAVGSPAP